MFDISLLPHQPEAFFGFSDGESFERRDLKRAYGKAIRLFNPETRPEEFRKVRDAYERLEKALRYGQKREQSIRMAEAWQPPAEVSAPEPNPAAAHRPGASAHESTRTGSSSKTPSSKSTPTSRPKLTLRQLAVIDPPAAQRQLQAKRVRTAQDYYLAAILADANSGKPTATYLTPLLDGLAVYPDDPGLITLVTEFLRTEVPDAAIPKVVRFIANKLRTPLFYPLTEPLWSRLVKTREFAEVSDLLTSCEQSLQQSSPDTRATFYLQLMKGLIWTAPPDWVDRHLGELETHAIDLNPLAQADLEWLVEIRSLLRETEQHAVDPIRQQLLTAFQLTSQSDDTVSVARALQILTDLAGEAAAIEASFPVPGRESDALWVTLTYRAVDQLQHYLDEPEPAVPQRLVVQMSHLLNDLEPSKNVLDEAATKGDIRFLWGPLLLFMLFNGIVGVLLLLSVSLALWGDIGPISMTLGIGALLGGTLWSYFRWLFPKYLLRRAKKANHRAVMRAYAKHWRARLFRFARSSSEPWESQLGRLQGVASHFQRDDTGQTVLVLAREDAGLAIFANLQTLLR